MILPDHALRAALAASRLVVDPLGPGAVQPASIDLRLGPTVLRLRPTTWRLDARCPQDAAFEPTTYPLDARVVIPPHGFVLGETLERITIGPSLAAQLGGKALALDTKIPTPTGWTTMADVQTGDLVFGGDGQPTRVIAATTPMLGRPCYEVILDDRTKIVADAEHQWLTWDRPTRSRVARGYKGVQTPQLHTTHEIAQTMTYCGTRNHAIDAVGVQLPDRALPLDPYVLGHWLGDGHTAAAVVTMGHEDYSEIAEQYATAMMPLTPTSAPLGHRFGRAPDRRRDAVARSQTGNALLRGLGVLGHKHIPLAYLRASWAQRWALLQGLMDADGHADLRGDRVEITVTNGRLAQDIAELLASLGIKAYPGARPARCQGKECGTAYRLTWRPLIVPFRLSRKALRIHSAQRVTNETTRRVIDIVRPVDSVPVRCIQVEAPDGIFLVSESFVPTHNSSLARMGIAVHVTAGFIDPGWGTNAQGENAPAPLTLELVNHTPIPVRLYVGQAVAQLQVWQLAAEVEQPYRGHYADATGPQASRAHLQQVSV